MAHNGSNITSAMQYLRNANHRHRSLHQVFIPLPSSLFPLPSSLSPLPSSLFHHPSSLMSHPSSLLPARRYARSVLNTWEKCVFAVYGHLWAGHKAKLHALYVPLDVYITLLGSIYHFPPIVFHNSTKICPKIAPR